MPKPLAALGTALVSLLLLDASPASARGPGDLDPSFGDGGRVVTGVGENNAGVDVVRQPDGKLVALSSAASAGTDLSFALHRFLTDGRADATFGGGDGVVEVNVTNGEVPSALALDGVGRLVVTGGNLDGEVFVARLLPAGTLDPAFGTGGVVTTDLGADPGSTGARGSAVVVDPAGQPVVAGTTGDPANDGFVARYSAAGALDGSFGTAGVRLVSATSELVDLVRRADGRFLAAGVRPSADDVVVGLTAAGALDPGYGTGGLRTVSVEHLGGIALDGDGRVVAAGSTDVADDRNDLRVVRTTPGGSLDATFGGDGSVARALPDDARVGSATVDDAGRIVVGGSGGVVARFLGDGSPDSGFGQGGLSLEGGIAAPVVQPNGAVVAVGTVVVADSDSPSPIADLTDMRVARLLGGSVPPEGYCEAHSDGSVLAHGDCAFFGTAAVQAPSGRTLDAPVVGSAPTATGEGYWLVASDGGAFAFGDARFHGSMGGRTLARPIVGMAATPTGDGYWLVASDGGIFAFGDARFLGSMGGRTLARPIVGMAATPTGDGYWLVASDGGIFAFGDATFHGSTGNLRLVRPVVGMAAHPTGEGYWLVASDGGVFTFGPRARFFGSTGDIQLAQPVVAMAANNTGRGYWLLAQDGGIFAFGDATFSGSGAGRSSAPAVALFHAT